MNFDASMACGVKGQLISRRGKEGRKAVESERTPPPSLAPLCKNKVCRPYVVARFLIGHLYLNGIMLSFEVKNGHQKDTCYDSLCAQTIDTGSGYIINTKLGGSL